MSVEIKIKNVNETITKLYAFSSKLGNRITRSALRSGANLTLKAARREAPKGDSGRLKRAIRVVGNKKFNPRRNGKVGVSIKIRRGKSRTDPKGAFYAHFVLGGTKRGIKPNPFIKRAYDSTKTLAAKLIIKNIEQSGRLLIKRF